MGDKKKRASAAAANGIAAKPFQERSKPQQKLLLHQVSALVSWLSSQGLQKSAEKLPKFLAKDLGDDVSLPQGNEIKGSWKFVKAKDYDTESSSSEEESSSSSEESSSEEEEQSKRRKSAKAAAAAKKKPVAKKKKSESSSSSGEESSSEEEAKKKPTKKKTKDAPKKKPAKKEESSSSEDEEEAKDKVEPEKMTALESLITAQPTAQPRKRSTAQSRKSMSFQMFKDMEAKEEYQKLKMAGFLRELHKLAKEEKKKEIRDSMASLPPFADSSRHGPSQRRVSGYEGGGNISLHGIDLEDISKDTALDIIVDILEGRGEGDNILDGNSVLKLVQAAIKVMGEQETVVDLREQGHTTTTVVGDLHGSLDCLKHVLELVGLDKAGTNAKENQVVIFDGDYVDRGANSLEVICTLLLLKISQPEKVHLLRGNHEDTMTASIYGFREEIDRKYDDPTQAEEIWYEFGYLFAAFPICAWTKNAAVMHGGIPYQGFGLERVNEVTPDVRVQLKTIVDPYDEDEEVVQGVMWSDPSANPGISPNDRGGGSQFGPDITREFLDEHDVRYVIRAHEPFESGTDHQDVGDGRGCVTVFSASNYPNGEGTNLGAVLHLDEEQGTYEICTFNSAGGGNTAYEKLLKTFVDDHRAMLTKAFRAVQAEDGTVTPEQWAKVMGDELELPDVDWMELQEDLAPTEDGTEDGKIDWSVFLARHSTKIPNQDMLPENQLSVLHQHKDKFLNVFQLLDADGSGTISEEEFVHGINTLNWHIGVADIKDPAKLYKVFDTDGDGEITIEEFCRGLEESAAFQKITDKLDANEVQALQENHEMLLLAFKYLDTDNSGAIDHEEFMRGFELLNKRLPDRSKISDPEELFLLLDADGNGEIDMNEFNAMFHII